MSTWTDLSPCPKSHGSQPVVLNRDEFIVAVHDGIYLYNIKRNQWSLFMHYPDDYNVQSFQRASICYDSDSHQLYVNNGLYKILSINVREQTHTMHQNLYLLGWHPRSVVLNGEYHILGGSDNPNHLKWSASKQKWQSLFTFPDFCDGIESAGVVARRNEIFLFGGSDMVCNKDVIWRYCAEQQMWNKMSCRLAAPSSKFGYALSSDGQFVFVLGGLEAAEASNKIYVIDLKRGKVMRSRVKCPAASTGYHAVIVPKLKGSLSLSTGYIRRYIRSLETASVPRDIIDYISSWYGEDYLYLLGNDAHCKINIERLLENAIDV